jgi:hypothetical protein
MVACAVQASGGLSRQLFAALGATCGQHKTAAFGRHTGAKAMAAGANQVRGLKRALHSDLHRAVRGAMGFAPEPQVIQIKSRRLGGRGGQVNSLCKKMLQQSRLGARLIVSSGAQTRRPDPARAGSSRIKAA